MSGPQPQRVALVTGGAGGIGREVCRLLAADHRRVVVADLDAVAAKQTAADIDGATAVAMDVTDPVSVTTALDAAGPVDIVVNCVGTDRLMPFVDTDDDFTARMLEVNLAGPMRVVRLALPAMMARGWGRIVNLSSDAGRVGSSLSTPYSAAKGGLIAFTKAMAREAVRHGVTANTVCPGPTDTALIERITAETDDAAKVMAAMVRSVPMKRLAEPAEIAPAIVFLASDHAGFITGQTLSVSGGLTMV
jgi:2-hydroxycyclohexanecarboxyl-CoA dehydrogenase